RFCHVRSRLLRNVGGVVNLLISPPTSERGPAVPLPAVSRAAGALRRVVARGDRKLLHPARQARRSVQRDRDDLGRGYCLFGILASTRAAGGLTFPQPPAQNDPMNLTLPPADRPRIRPGLSAEPLDGDRHLFTI